MVILDEVKRRLSELAPEVTDLHDALAIERSRVARPRRFWVPIMSSGWATRST